MNTLEPVLFYIPISDKPFYLQFYQLYEKERMLHALLYSVYSFTTS